MKQNALLRGTLLLTAAGLASRFIGFFYRIFLSRMFGEEGMGIYELMNPVLALTFALCTSGIQSAVSRFVAACPDPAGKSRLRILLSGLALSGALSVLCTLGVYQGADFIAASLLGEARCAPLLRIASLSFPAACIHSCINGYYYGIRRASLPAFCQLFEQCFRVGSVFLFWEFSQQNNVTFSINVAAVGLMIGEFAAVLAAVPAAWLHFSSQKRASLPLPESFPSIWGRLIRFAAPLSANRVCLHLLGAAESARIPVSLQLYGYTAGQALSIYGVFSGMAMTCILFPSALTNSVSVLLMPLVAQAQVSGDQKAIRRAVGRCARGCLLLGLVCMAFFRLTGRFIGGALFDSELAGLFIRTLSLLCPFLYLNTTLLSVLNGLGRTGHTFLLNLLSLFVRLAFVFFLIPLWGIKGYFCGMLAGQLVMTLSCSLLLRRFLFARSFSGRPAKGRVLP
ncbi:MAG: polysaccharide biosynthesis protein [Eubacteriales bacterium]|nr:polysaccharide biosynthesis protein [Eubacteriales bacterium]